MRIFISPPQAIIATAATAMTTVLATQHQHPSRRDEFLHPSRQVTTIIIGATIVP
jgi:hypothetical protein